MMIWKEILIRYGELSTKGRNKMDFIRRLRENIRHAFADLGHLHIRTERDRMFIAIQDQAQMDVLLNGLPKILGFNHSVQLPLVTKTLRR